MRQSRRAFLESQLAEQRKWIRKCGGDLLGYICHYGEADDPNKHGEGGRAIYEADMAELHRIEQLLNNR